MTLKDLALDDAAAAVENGAAFADLRPVERYLEVHVPGSLALVFEFGPGMAARARDCLPLSVPLILLQDAATDTKHAAAALRGKGFSVPGMVRDGVTAWGRAHGHPRSTDVITTVPDGAVVLDVADPGAAPPEDAERIPVDRLWHEAARFAGSRVAVASGYGVRAALAVGIIERAGAESVAVLATRR